MNAVKNQEESEKPINGQKIAKARKATKGVSLVPTGKLLAFKNLCLFSIIYTMFVISIIAVLKKMFCFIR